MLQQAVFHPCRVGLRLVNFIDRHNNRRFCRLGMVNRLNGLRHDAIIGSHDQNNNIGHFGAARAHGGKGGMTRRVNESHRRAIRRCGLISTNMLGDATGLAIGHFGLTQRIKQRGFAVVNMTHHRDNRRALAFIFIGIIFAQNCRFDIAVRYPFDGMSQIFGNNLGGIGINHIGDFGHHALLHQDFNHIDGALGHPIGQFLNADCVGQLDGARDFLILLHTGRLTPFALAAAAHGGQ